MKSLNDCNLEWAVILWVCLVCLLTVCIPILEMDCASIFIDCPGTDYDSTLPNTYILLSTEIRGNTLYFRLKDCETNKILQSSVSAHCFIEKI